MSEKPSFRNRPARLFRPGPPVAAIAGLVLLLLAGAAAALSSEPAFTDQGEVRLVSAVTATGDDATVRLGLHFTLREGWKVYWRSPGPGGYPPAIDWTGSRNLAAAEMSWPAPDRFEILGFESLGYHDEVVYPITATLDDPGRRLELRARVDFLTCSEICVPHTVALAVDVPAGPAGTSAEAHLVDRFWRQVPGDGTASGLTVESVEVEGPAAAPTLRILAGAREPFVDPDLFVEGPAIFEFGGPAVRLREGGRLAVLTVPGGAVGDDVPSLVGETLTLTLRDGARSVETRMVVQAAPVSPVSTPLETRGLLVVLLLALIGGFILNLMPCVLPVLSIKLLGLVGHGGRERRTIRISFLSSAAGIMASFMVLAGAAALVRSAGLTVGWGMQFQQPAFLVFMAVLLTLFAGNLWGLFGIRLPGALSDLAGRAHGEGHLGDFGTGAFATLLATPCSAPFLGTAISFALTSSTGDIFLVFAALGLGLALPWLGVAALPGLAARLPRPGPWMIRLRVLLGFALALTAVWLLTVLAAQIGGPGAFFTGLGLLALIGLLWLRKSFTTMRAVIAGLAAVLVLAFAVPVLRTGLLTSGRGAAAENAAIDWQPFQRDAIAGLVADGRTVFVDVTADWCITCQANKALVLNREAVAGRLGAGGTVAMMADWTRPDDGIADFLSDYDRYGIPFDIVFGPGAPGGIMLPELLTTDAVLAALGQASAPATGMASGE